MPKKEITFSAGDIIFKQGDECATVYTIVDGKAELFYEINGKARPIGVKGEDDTLGANCVLEGTYDTSARAATDLTVFAQSADEYIAFLQRSGELSPNVGTTEQNAFSDEDDDDFSFSFDDGEEKTAAPVGRGKRRAASSRRSGRSVASASASGDDGFSFGFDDDEDGGKKPLPASASLVHVEKPKPPVRPIEQKPVVLPADIKRSPVREWFKEAKEEKPVFGSVVLLASVAGDDGSIRDELYRVLSQIPNVVVKVVDKAVVDANPDRGAMQMRAWLEQHRADVGLYAQIDNAGRVLEFHAVRPSNPVETPLFSAGGRFFLPVRMTGEQQTLLKVFAVSAITPTRLEHEQLLRLFLPTLINEVAAYASKPMVGLTAEEQAANLTAFANVLSWNGYVNPAENRRGLATDLYERALDLLPPHAPEYVFVNRQVGLLRQMEAERRDSVEAYRVAEETFKKGLSALSEKYQPEACGDLNLRIGNVRQKIAMQTGAGEDFVSAMTAYRDALKTLKPVGQPERWADSVNGLARTMQLFSSYGTKTTLLEKAIELYEKELTVLDRDSQPLLWARAGNNLASALFLLADRKGGAADLLRRAVEVFSDALRVYDEIGAHQMADVTGSNLKRAERVLAETEKELEKNKNWLDDILNDGEKTGDKAENADEPLTFERIAVFEELDDDE